MDSRMDKCAHGSYGRLQGEPTPCMRCRIAELEAENAKLKEAARAVVDEKARLSTYLGGPVSINELNKRISALAAALEGKQQ